MTQTDRFHTHAAAANRPPRRSPHASAQSGHRLSTRLISDAVVASYIHDISQRHRDGAHGFEARGRRLLSAVPSGAAHSSSG